MSRLAGYMKHPNRVISSYACATIERLFFVKTEGNKHAITKEMLSQYIVAILEPLCELLKGNMNNYGIKTLYRVLQLSGSDVVPYSVTLGQMYVVYLDRAIKESSNQMFNYLLFECVGLTVKILKDYELEMTRFEEIIAPAMFDIVAKNNADLISYAFQILSLFVFHCKTLKENYEVKI